MTKYADKETKYRDLINFISEHNKKEFLDDDLLDVSYNSKHNFTIVHPTYEERFKLQVEENEKLLKENQMYEKNLVAQNKEINELHTIIRDDTYRIQEFSLKKNTEIEKLKSDIRVKDSWINKLINDKKSLETKINELEEINKEFLNRMCNVYDFLSSLSVLNNNEILLDKSDLKKIRNMFLRSK